MPKRNTKNRTIQITDFAFEKIMAWSQALDEVGFFAVGKGFVITDAFRVMNLASSPRNWFFHLKKEENEIRQKVRSLGLEVICQGHSHPHHLHLKRPSKADYSYFPKKSYQMICFPIERRLGVWFFSKSYQNTLKSQIKIQLQGICGDVNLGDKCI